MPRQALRFGLGLAGATHGARRLRVRTTPRRSATSLAVLETAPVTPKLFHVRLERLERRGELHSPEYMRRSTSAALSSSDRLVVEALFPRATSSPRWPSPRRPRAGRGQLGARGFERRAGSVSRRWRRRSMVVSRVWLEQRVEHHRSRAPPSRLTKAAFGTPAWGYPPLPPPPPPGLLGCGGVIGGEVGPGLGAGEAQAQAQARVVAPAPGSCPAARAAEVAASGLVRPSLDRVDEPAGALLPGPGLGGASAAAGSPGS